MRARPFVVAVLVTGLVGPVLAGCSDGGGSPSSAASSSSAPATTSSSATAQTPSVSPSATATSTPTATDTPTATAPATVALTGNGVGDLAWDSPGATAAVEALLGPPDSIDAFPQECGVAGVSQLRYGGLWIAVQDDTLMAWQAGQSGPVPANATLPEGVAPGQTLSAALARAGAGTPVLLDNYGVYQVQVNEPGVAAPVFYWADSTDPGSTLMLVAARYMLGCG